MRLLTLLLASFSPAAAAVANCINRPLESSVLANSSFRDTLERLGLAPSLLKAELERVSADMERLPGLLSARCRAEGPGWCWDVAGRIGSRHVSLAGIQAACALGLGPALKSLHWPEAEAFFAVCARDSAKCARSHCRWIPVPSPYAGHAAVLHPDFVGRLQLCCSTFGCGGDCEHFFLRPLRLFIFGGTMCGSFLIAVVAVAVLLACQMSWNQTLTDANGIIVGAEELMDSKDIPDEDMLIWAAKQGDDTLAAVRDSVHGAWAEFARFGHLTHGDRDDSEPFNLYQWKTTKKPKRKFCRFVNLTKWLSGARIYDMGLGDYFEIDDPRDKDLYATVSAPNGEGDADEADDAGGVWGATGHHEVFVPKDDSAQPMHSGEPTTHTNSTQRERPQNTPSTSGGAREISEIGKQPVSKHMFWFKAPSASLVPTTATYMQNTDATGGKSASPTLSHAKVMLDAKEEKKSSEPVDGASGGVVLDVESRDDSRQPGVPWQGPDDVAPQPPPTDP